LGFHWIQFLDAATDVQQALPTEYDTALVVLSYVSAAIASLYTVRWAIRQTAASPVTVLLLGGAIMGLAVTAMHYTGMWVATFLQRGTSEADTPPIGMDAAP
jgi:NO-binding membrane sensor protein with MHYT domain